jgi:antitoxin (DNA-binding transcriptional repressor) of toxin-antitoxin stability system
MVNAIATIDQELRIMEEIAISKFKATCLAVLERVRKTGQPIRVTRFGQIIAEIQPPSSARSPRRFGRHIGSAVILGDIVGPIGDESDWEAARDPELDESKNEK